jgi:hypothetical protein
LNTLETNGPNYLAIKELGYIQKKEIRDLENRYDLMVQAEQDFVQRIRLREDLQLEVQLMRAQHNRAMTQLTRHHQEEIVRTGIDPDAAARARAEERNRIRHEEWRQRREAWANAQAQNDANVAADNLRLRVAVLVGGNAVQQQAAPRVGELGHFARDAQNVHTTVAVKQTKDMVNRILKIVVPTEYKWNMTTCSKTPGEIIVDCSLTPKGAWQMSAKYCQDEDVYDMGKGIYGRTLDGVWQYITKSPDKKDLCRILRQEMEDNVGMCAQGNLTRLCNILSGYMEGIGVQESPAEILGRKLPMLVEIVDDNERLVEAYKLLVETGVPQEQWLSWVEPLVDRTIQLKANGAGQVIGLEFA